ETARGRLSDGPASRYRGCYRHRAVRPYGGHEPHDAGDRKSGRGVAQVGRPIPTPVGAFRREMQRRITGENAMSSTTKVKDVLTTGEVAKICSVAPRTVSKWFDSGALNGYRIPGSKDRRIPLNQLIRFMKQHGMPLNGLMTGSTRVLIVDNEQDVVEVLEKILEDEAKFEVEVCKGGFEAGVSAEKFRPHVILLDMSLGSVDAREVCKQVKSSQDLQLTKVIAMSSKLTDDEAKALQSNGFDGFLRKPF